VDLFNISKRTHTSDSTLNSDDDVVVTVSGSSCVRAMMSDEDALLRRNAEAVYAPQRCRTYAVTSRPAGRPEGMQLDTLFEGVCLYGYSVVGRLGPTADPTS